MDQRRSLLTAYGSRCCCACTTLIPFFPSKLKYLHCTPPALSVHITPFSPFSSDKDKFLFSSSLPFFHPFALPTHVVVVAVVAAATFFSSSFFRPLSTSLLLTTGSCCCRPSTLLLTTLCPWDLLGSPKDLARFRSINGVTGGDDTPQKNPNNPAPTYPSKSTTQNFTAAPSLLLLLLLLLHNQSSKTDIPKTKKTTKPDTELMPQTVIPKNKQTNNNKSKSPAPRNPRQENPNRECCCCWLKKTNKSQVYCETHKVKKIQQIGGATDSKQPAANSGCCCSCTSL